MQDRTFGIGYERALCSEDPSSKIRIFTNESKSKAELTQVLLSTNERCPGAQPAREIHNVQYREFVLPIEYAAKKTNLLPHISGSTEDRCRQKYSGNP